MIAYKNRKKLNIPDRLLPFKSNDTDDSVVGAGTTASIKSSSTIERKFVVHTKTNVAIQPSTPTRATTIPTTRGTIISRTVALKKKSSMKQQEQTINIINNNTKKNQSSSSYYQSPAGLSTTSTAPTDMSTPIHNHSYNNHQQHQQQDDNTSNHNNDYETTKVLLDYSYGNDDNYDTDVHVDNKNTSQQHIQYEEDITYAYENDDDDSEDIVVEFYNENDDTNYSNNQYPVVQQQLNGYTIAITDYTYSQKVDDKFQSQFQSQSQEQQRFQKKQDQSQEAITERVVYNRNFTNTTFILMVTVIICIHILGYTIDQKLFYTNNTNNTAINSNNNHIASQWFTIMWSVSISLISSSLPIVVLWDTNTYYTNTNSNSSKRTTTTKPIRIVLSSIIVVIWTIKIIATLLLCNFYYYSSSSQEQQLQRIDNTTNNNSYDIILSNNLSVTISSRCIEWIYMTFIMLLVIGPYTLGLTSSTTTTTTTTTTTIRSLTKTSTGTDTTNTLTQNELLYIDVSKRTITCSVILCIFGFLWSLLCKVIHPKYSSIVLDYVTKLTDDINNNKTSYVLSYIVNFLDSTGISSNTNTSNVLSYIVNFLDSTGISSNTITSIVLPTLYIMKSLFLSPIVSDLFIYIGICTMNSPSLIEYNDYNNTSTSSISSSAVDFIDEEHEVDEEECGTPNKRSTGSYFLSYIWTIRRRVLSNCMAIVLFILLSQYNAIVVPNNHVLHWYITGQYTYYNNNHDPNHNQTTTVSGIISSTNNNNTTNEFNEQIQQKYSIDQEQVDTNNDIIESVHSTVVDNKSENPSRTRDQEQYMVSEQLYDNFDDIHDINKSSYDVYGIDDSKNIDTATTTTSTIPVFLEDDKDDDSQKVLENQDQLSTTTTIDTNKNSDYQNSHDDVELSPNHESIVSSSSSSSTDKYEAGLLTPKADDDDEIVATTLLGFVGNDEVLAESMILSVDEDNDKTFIKISTVSSDDDGGDDETVTESIVPDYHNNDNDKDEETITTSRESAVDEEEASTVSMTSTAHDNMEPNQELVNNDIAITTTTNSTVEESTGMDSNEIEEKELDTKLETNTMIEMKEILKNDDGDSDEDTLTTRTEKKWFGFGFQHQEEEEKKTIQEYTRTTTESISNAKEQQQHQQQQEQERIKSPTNYRKHKKNNTTMKTTPATSTPSDAIIDADIGTISNFTIKELLVTIVLGGTYILPVVSRNDPTIIDHTTIESFHSFQPVVESIVYVLTGNTENDDNDNEYEYDYDYNDSEERE